MVLAFGINLQGDPQGKVANEDLLSLSKTSDAHSARDSGWRGKQGPKP